MAKIFDFFRKKQKSSIIDINYGKGIERNSSSLDLKTNSPSKVKDNNIKGNNYFSITDYDLIKAFNSIDEALNSYIDSNKEVKGRFFEENLARVYERNKLEEDKSKSNIIKNSKDIKSYQKPESNLEIPNIYENDLDINSNKNSFFRKAASIAVVGIFFGTLGVYGAKLHSYFNTSTQINPVNTKSLVNEIDFVEINNYPIKKNSLEAKFIDIKKDSVDDEAESQMDWVNIDYNSKLNLKSSKDKPLSTFFETNYPKGTLVQLSYFKSSGKKIVLKSYTDNRGVVDFDIDKKALVPLRDGKARLLAYSKVDNFKQNEIIAQESVPKEKNKFENHIPKDSKEISIENYSPIVQIQIKTQISQDYLPKIHTDLKKTQRVKYAPVSSNLESDSFYPQKFNSLDDIVKSYGGSISSDDLNSFVSNLRGENYNFQWQANSGLNIANKYKDLQTSRIDDIENNVNFLVNNYGAEEVSKLTKSIYSLMKDNKAIKKNNLEDKFASIMHV